MGIFATRSRQITGVSAGVAAGVATRSTTGLDLGGPEAGVELSEELRRVVPPHFEAVGEALASGSSSVDACAVVGHDLARQGVSLEEALEGLRATYHLVAGADPDYASMRGVSVAWGESTLGYLHQLSCEDPLTGLATMAHVRGRLSELYRGELTESLGVREAYALVVVDASRGREGTGGSRADVLTHALVAHRLGETVRGVFAGPETIGRLGPARVVVLARRDERLVQRAALLRRMVSTPGGGSGGARVWIEGLPGSDAAAGALLDELRRL